MTTTTRCLALLLTLIAATPALAQVEIERRKPVRPRGELSVDSDFGSITVRAWDRSEVLVRGVLAAGAEGLDFDVDKDGAYVSVEVPQAWRQAAGEDAAFRSSLEIQAPTGWAIDVETLNAQVIVDGFTGAVEVSSVNGPVRVAGAVASVEIETMTGTVAVEASAASMDLRTISGGIVARGATGEVRIESLSGNVEVSGAKIRKLEVETTTGSVEIRGSLAARGEIDVETFSSPVRLVLPKTVRTTFELESFSGEIRSDFCTGTPLLRERFEPFKRLRCSTGGGESSIEVKTHAGDIAVVTE